ncbi:iron uptake transporter deferrochelatase/peroxidase subunit [Janibacter massiliensis]|uniref:iron uptake transporter deferrochelatase/peroxidase subunit n=1 Tax=Janibacter massiliensis TaxID=2058291 RepID=UPI000D0FD3F5|nr:iron uptake transporter deferrochelatase/peroxidase subunit [Janibacter massiliensis]
MSGSTDRTTASGAAGPRRRHLLATAAGATLAGGLAAAQAFGGPGQQAPAAPADGGDDPAGRTHPFRGDHQAGVTTPAQDRMHFVALDVTTDDRQALQDMLRAWTRAAERMVAGAEAAPGGAVGLGPHGVPTDTGEALDLPPAGLTITIGYGPSLFRRFGLETRRPAGLEDLPRFGGDDLDPARSGGDLCIQACADDPQVAVHAVRNLIRLGFGTVAVRWSQLGFGRTSSTSTSQATPRNLFGFKDGTSNIKAEEGAALQDHVWVQAQDVPGASWMTGGTYLVARRIRMNIEVWDRSTLQEQEASIGRAKLSGAPLGGKDEFEQPDFTRPGTDGASAIDVRSHVRLAHPSSHGGRRILRRGYTFIDGSDGLGHLDAGLFFIAFCRDVGRQFVPIQRALSRSDLLNEYIEHTGSAVFACPGGLGEGEDWGTQLLG